MSSDLNTQHDKLDRILEGQAKLDERSKNQGAKIDSIDKHLVQLNSKTSKNITDIALLKQKWAAVAILAPILITVGLNAVMQYV